MTLNTYTRGRHIEVLGNPLIKLETPVWAQGRGRVLSKGGDLSFGISQAASWGLGTTACLCLRVQTRPLPHGRPPCGLAVSPKSAPWAGRPVERGGECTLIAFTQARVCQLWWKPGILLGLFLKSGQHRAQSSPAGPLPGNHPAPPNPPTPGLIGWSPTM